MLLPPHLPAMDLKKRRLSSTRLITQVGTCVQGVGQQPHRCAAAFSCPGGNAWHRHSPATALEAPAPACLMCAWPHLKHVFKQRSDGVEARLRRSVQLLAVAAAGKGTPCCQPGRDGAAHSAGAPPLHHARTTPLVPCAAWQWRELTAGPAAAPPPRGLPEAQAAPAAAPPAAGAAPHPGAPPLHCSGPRPPAQRRP